LSRKTSSAFFRTAKIPQGELVETRGSKINGHAGQEPIEDGATDSIEKRPIFQA
jgi:hypothetical protein